MAGFSALLAQYGTAVGLLPEPLLMQQQTFCKILSFTPNCLNDNREKIVALSLL